MFCLFPEISINTRERGEGDVVSHTGRLNEVRQTEKDKNFLPLYVSHFWILVSFSSFSFIFWSF